MPERLFTTHQVGELLGATPREVLEWIRRGWLPCQHLPDGAARITEQGLIHFLKGRGIDIMQLMVSTAVRAGPAPQGRPARPGREHDAQKILAPLPSEEEVAALLEAAGDGNAGSCPTEEPQKPPQPVEAETQEDLAARAMLSGPAVGPADDGPRDVAPPADAEDAESALPPLDIDGQADLEPLSAQEAEALAIAALNSAYQKEPALAPPKRTEPLPQPAGAEARQVTAAPGAAEAAEPSEVPTAEVPAAPSQAPQAPPTAEPAPQPQPSPQAVPTTQAGPPQVPAEEEFMPAIEPEGPADAAEQVAQAILEDAIARGASAVHLEQRADGPILRLRVDGRLQDKPNFARRLPAGLAPHLAQRLLTWAGLDGDNPARPQSGQMTRTIDGRPVDFRLCSLPTLHGPRLALTVHDRDVPPPDLAVLGLADAHRARLEMVLAAASGGLVLVAGPVPRDVQAALRSLTAAACEGDRAAVALSAGCSAEHAGPCTVPVAPLDGWGFADASRAALDQDAEVLVISQLRDPRTAAAALEAAWAGSLVLAGLPAGDVARALEDLAEMGLDAWAVCSALKAVLFYRTVRRLCAACRCQVPLPADFAGELATGDGRPLEAIFAPVGCARCGGSGFAGMATLASLLLMDGRNRRDLRAAWQAGDLAAFCRQAGAPATAELATGLLRDGVTSLNEILCAP